MEEPVTRISLPTFVINPDDCFHVVRRTITSNENLEYHDHDYAEIFWIKEGEGIHILNGERLPITKGYLCMIRPTDCHTFVSKTNPTGLVVTNIAFYLDSLKLFKERYFPDSNSFFWTDAKQPFSVNLGTDELNEISGITDYILPKPRDFMHLDLIMLHIFKVLLESHVTNTTIVPHWLSYAIEQYQTPMNFQKGVAGFVELTGRSTDHVNKVVREYLNQTLTETVTKIKMTYAAQRLTMTNVPIKTICYNCGYNAIGHFYKVFNKHYGMTPKDFRQTNHKVF